MKLHGSRRLAQLGSAIFAEVDEWKKEAVKRGLEIIDLGIGSPDQPPSERVVTALEQAVRQPHMYGYPTSVGGLRFRQTAVEWCMHRFGIDIDPEKEIITLMGSQDGLAHLALALTDPGDVAMVPDPGYPIYSASLALAGVEPYFLALNEESGFLPRLDEIPASVAEQAKFMLLNYPSNPLAAVADLAFFERVIAYARKHEILVVHDLAYSELTFDGYRPPSILEVSGAKDIAVEFHSLSKSFNMAGCRIGFMIGQQHAVQALKTLKANIDYGVFMAVQEAGIAALEEDMSEDTSVARLYQNRRDVMVDELRKIGWNVSAPKATMFIWAKVPEGWTSRQISREILLQTGVVVIPGDAFGSAGEGYVRIALVQDEAVLRDAAVRVGEFLQSNRR